MKYPNLKQWSPYGDLSKRDDQPERDAFPHQIKSARTEHAAPYIPATSLSEVTGLPTPVDTRVTVGLGAQGPQGRKSTKWKAVICKDENASTAPLGNRQMANVTTVATTNQAGQPASKFKAKIFGAYGVETQPWNGEGRMFGHKNMRMSNVAEAGGVSARSSRYAARVVTAPGNPAIATVEETFGGRTLKNKKVRNV